MGGVAGCKRSRKGRLAMMTLRRFAAGLESIPTAVAWFLADLGESRGRQELYTRQAPQRLRVLREHAIVESAVSSNRIEGVEIDRGRVAAVVFGTPALRDRNEEEVAGYRDALASIHERGASLPISATTILDLHRLSRGPMWDAGKLKDADGEIVEIAADGRRRVRFAPLAAAESPGAIDELCSLWRRILDKGQVPPLVAVAGFGLDYLCIHPFRDGNGRVARLLLLLQLEHLGFNVGRYISLERLIEANKERYFETLEASSRGWHEGAHDPWPYIGCLLSLLKQAYREFEDRAGRLPKHRGARTKAVIASIESFPGEFTLVGLERACPEASRDLIRWVLRDLRRAGAVSCTGRGPGARWHRVEKA